MKLDPYLPRARKLADWVINFIQKRPSLYRVATNFNEFHNNWMGYRKLGLLRDDLIFDEDQVVQEALGRLPDKEIFDRNFRMRRAIQLNAISETLPRAEWTTAETDRRYLWPVIEQVCKEQEELERFDSKQ